ncbi:MAG: hypothetical protein AB8F78_18330 [Saprospiraceae bacterium]
MNEEIIDDGVVHLSGSESSQPLDANTANTIMEAAKWGKLYLILAAIGLVLQPIIQYFNMRKAQAALGVEGDTYLVAAQMGTQLFTYIITFAILGYPIYRFYEFVTKTPLAIERQAQSGFVEGISGLKSTFKYLGIATLVFIGFYVLLVVIGIAAFVFMDLFK